MFVTCNAFDLSVLSAEKSKEAQFFLRDYYSFCNL